MKWGGVALLMIVVCLLRSRYAEAVAATGGFVGVRGTHFVLDAEPFFANGFNAYWLMVLGSDPSQRTKVSAALREAASHGLTVARTWAFNDGGSNPLQYSPGSYNENMFKGLDFAIWEARRHGIRLILSLVNNYDNFGGKKQYVEWARSYGRQRVPSQDDFYNNSVAKLYYKNHVKTVLTRINTLTGVAYKDDPTIFAWELMNEPRCTSDASGKTMQAWIMEMAAHVKSMDTNHLLEVGLEGFYGHLSYKIQDPKLGLQVGTDFIANNQIAGVDFATFHSYPDQWLSDSDERAQLDFFNKWLDAHIHDATNVLRKPLLLTEFGKSRNDPGFNDHHRDALFSTAYHKIYWSARTGGAAAGAMFWQLLTQGMDSYKDGYEIFLDQKTSTSYIISHQSRLLRNLGKISRMDRRDRRQSVSASATTADLHPGSGRGEGARKHKKYRKRRAQQV